MPEAAVRRLASGLGNSALSALLREGRYDERGAAGDVTRARIMQQLQRTGGNRAAQRWPQTESRARDGTPPAAPVDQELPGAGTLSASAGVDPVLAGGTGGALERSPSRPLIHRQTAPPANPDPPPQEGKRYKVTLSTGTFEDLTEAEAVAKLSESYKQPQPRGGTGRWAPRDSPAGSLLEPRRRGRRVHR